MCQKINVSKCNLRIWQNQGLVDKPTIHPHHSHLFTSMWEKLEFWRKKTVYIVKKFRVHLGELESSNCVAHFTVDSIHTVVAIDGNRLPMLKMANLNQLFWKVFTGQRRRGKFSGFQCCQLYLSSDISFKMKDPSCGGKPGPNMAGGKGATPGQGMQ